MTSDGGSLELDLIAASLRADGSDVATFVEGLAVKLEEAVPGAVSVQRVKQGFRGPKLVKTISVDAGGERLELQRERDRVVTRRARVSGGIVIKTEPVDIEVWMSALTEALAVEAGRSERTRQALQRLLLDT